MSSLNLLIGPPGTGKTEFDLRVIEAWLKGGASREQVAYFTFMKAAAADGARRMGVEPGEARGLWFRTLHSACFRILKLERSSVVSPAWLRAFGKKIGIPMEGEEEGRGDVEEVAELILLLKTPSSDQKSEGSLYRRLYSLSRLLCRTPAELDRVRENPHPRSASYFWPNMRIGAYRSFVEIYEREKGKDGKLDFVDMLERVLRQDVALPPWKYAVIDEAQDLSALQLAVIEKLCINRCETTLLSGDDHQAIMTFQGASAREFLAYRKQARIIQLTQTHRFGQGIVDFSAKIAERIRHRQPREVVGLQGKESGIDEVYQFEGADVREGDLLMHRHVSGCKELAARLVAQGVPFWNERGPNPLARSSEMRAWLAWEAIRRRKVVTGDELQYLEAHVPARKDGVQLIVRGMAKKIKEMQPGHKIGFEDLPTYFTEAFRETLSKDDRKYLECPFSEYYERLTKGGHDILERPKTTITTIHGAKGRQAPRTWLFSETFPKALAGMSDDEHRVAYVGATRAQDRVLLVRDNIVGDWTGNYEYPKVG